ncbi:hypothetical protein NIES208_10720 [[Limnothrix rosea] IAM M-220]|nr:hypothetical protein NIES208_10720 [[Limnothrix rosea] IAM M-220]
MTQKYSIIGAACTTLLVTAMPALAQTSDTPEVMEDTMMMEDAEAMEDFEPLDKDVSTEAADLKIRPRFAVKRTTDVNGAEGLNYVGGFLPVFQQGGFDNFKIFFFDGGVSVDDDGEFGGNLLFGYRSLSEANRIFGSYLGLDVRGTEEENSFSQFTFGAESLGETFDARANVFLSLSDREAITPETANNFRFTGNRLLFDTSQRFQAAASGLDFEVGSKLTDWRRGDLRAYAGLYYYDIDGGEDSIGWRTRLVARPIPSVNVGLTLQDDDILAHS